MRRRVLGAAIGATAGAGLLAAVLAAWPARPDGGLLLAVVIIAVLAPAAATGGAALALWTTDRSAMSAGLRLTALGTPVLIVLLLFTIHAVAVSARPGLQQVGALVLGSASAAALAARFSGHGADDG